MFVGLIHQHVYYAYHRFGHQWSNRQKIGVHSLHHANRRYHNIIEPFGFIHYSILDQIIPYILFGSKYVSIILYLSIIEHIIAHGSMHLFPLESSKLHVFHHKYPLKYSYMGGNLLWDWLYGTLPPSSLYNKVRNQPS